jgi:membrane protein implicated in regulation of membrane protease activity
MSGWTLAKYVVALGGIALVLLADNIKRPWLGYAGLAVIAAAFLLRFVQRRLHAQGDGPRSRP